ncbi:MAG TPA: hypothetical protein VGC70_06790 [Burkholderiales bacterium]|jgi:hypothetical protein
MTKPECINADFTTAGFGRARAEIAGAYGINVAMEIEMRSLGSLIASLAIVLVFTAFLPSTAQANITLSQRACQSYASWSGNIVWARKLGADKEKARTELVELDEKTPSSIFALMLRNFESLWTTQASWEFVTRAVLEDCINRRGIYESAT